jgi:HupE/UreJ protein
VFLVPAGSAVGRGAAVGTVLWNYGRLGVEHILFGFDHLLFVLGLLLLVDSWPVLLKTITAFTLAHSLALALAVLGVVRVSPAPAEVLIALSIVLVALELTRAPDTAPTLTTRYPWAVAFGFGVVHGLGFAGALAEVGLPPDQIPLALLSFNLGVELGQAMFVGTLAVPLVLFRRHVAAASLLRRAPAYAIGAVAVAWTLERLERLWM